ncbi:MAG: response regulator transcription factor [Paenibacillaceae bacterium]|jgi:two-component system alkaline phosphatase synthesis response regulator PhoP|nr:response regulator transcription factor [Paenibacillaceae bacterium]
MQGTNKLTEAEIDPRLLPPADPESAFCPLTNRIVIISPFPQLLHELVRELTATCFDVMVFHQADPALLAQLQADLLIVDSTHQEGGTPWAWLNHPGLADYARLHLVRPDGRASAPDALEWPSPLPRIMERIHILMREGSGHAVAREQLQPGEEGVLHLKDLSVDVRRYAVQSAGARVDLTRTEFDLLRSIIEAEGSVLTRQDLLDRVWGVGYFGGSNTVDVHVKALRHKLGDDPRNPRYIATVRGIGYRAMDN